MKKWLLKRAVLLALAGLRKVVKLDGRQSECWRCIVEVVEEL